MSTVTMRTLSRNAGTVVDEVVRSGRPALVTRHGRPVVALVRIPEEELEDWILANASEFIEGRRQADEELARGETVSLGTFLAELRAEELDQRSIS